MSWQAGGKGGGKGWSAGKGNTAPPPAPSSRPGSLGPGSPSAGAQATAGASGGYTPRTTPGPTSAQYPAAAQGYSLPAGMPPATPGGTPQTIQVLGCTNATVANIIKGPYSPAGSNHGKPVYKKDGPAGSVSVLIYFWDERDGPNFSGWWFGPKVGGDQVWAYNGDKAAMSPPPSNWRVPWDGDVDHSLRLQSTTPLAGAPSGRLAHPQGTVPPPAARGPPPEVLRQRQEAEERRQREAQEAEQKRVAEMKVREEERRRREAEQRKRMEEERQRREAEARKRREEDEAKRKEQAAALAVRKVIQRVRVATPETYDNLRAELEEAQATHLEHLGSQAEKVSTEAEQTLQQAQRRIDEINEKRAEDARRRIEDERRTKEEAEKVARLVKEVGEDVTVTEGKVAEAEEEAKKVTEGQEASPDAIVELADATDTAISGAKEAVERSLKTLDAKWKDMGDNKAAAGVRSEMDDLHGRLMNGRKQLAKIGQVVSGARDKAARKATALKKEAERKDFFKRYDADQDGVLSRAEIAAFSKAELDGFEVPPQTMDRIMRIHEPVTYEKFHAMHLKVAIAQSEVKARALRAEQEERRRKLEAERAEVQKIIDGAMEVLTGAEKIIMDSEWKSQSALRQDGMPAEKIETTANALEAETKRAEGELARVLEKLKEAEAACTANPDLKGFDKKDVPRLRQRQVQGVDRIEKVMASVKKAREQAVRKAYAEIDQKRTEAVTAMRSFMSAESKTGEELFTSISDGSALKSDKFLAFIGGLSDLKLAEGESEKLFNHIAGEEKEISKERFLELIRLYYKCVKSTVLSEDIAIKSKTVRRLEVGEVLEAIGGPAKEDGAGVNRVKCTCVQDEATGWVTIAGNQGTAFLEPGGNFFSVVKETLLTDGLSVTDSKTVRRLAKGEVIEVLEFPKKDASVDVKRLRGKAKLDGASGWVTVASNQGTAFLEPC